jgi:hypothetical protein
MLPISDGANDNGEDMFEARDPSFDERALGKRRMAIG